MGRNQQSKGGGYAGNTGNKTYASGGKGGGGNKKTVDAAAALGLGVPQQNTMLSGLAGLGTVHQNPLDSRFGSVGMDTVAGLSGLNMSLQSVNSGNDLLQLAALLGGSQQQSVTSQRLTDSACSAPASTTCACTTTGNAGRGTASRNTETNRDRRYYTSSTRAAELVKIEKEKQKQQILNCRPCYRYS